MQFRRRLVIVCLLTIASLGIYALARYYAPILVAFVVEQTLVEKAPPGTDIAELRDQFRSLLSAAPTRSSKLLKSIMLSQYLEKVQRLTRPELETLLQQIQESSYNTNSSDPWNFFAADNV